MQTHELFSPTDILTIIKRHGIRQQDLANAFFIGKATIANWANGRRRVPRQYWPDLWALAGLSRLYGAAALTIWRPTVRAFGRPRADLWVPLSPSVPVPEDLAVLVRDSAGVLAEHAYLAAVLRLLTPYVNRHPVTTPLTPAEAETLRGLSAALAYAALDVIIPQTYTETPEEP